jgi:hypothetical protein
VIAHVLQMHELSESRIKNRETSMDTLAAGIKAILLNLHNQNSVNLTKEETKSGFGDADEWNRSVQMPCSFADIGTC